ncbi:glutamyl-tRNA reductase [Algisphaera agarilytica]|uniref:Glutamyl-tRNA reductase n=1 Tax=Algisphaera agarilytica TaxID=1385975 RepID=A0A7X0LJ58_9BACT|nr:glutamyl-tRNA reductase [Algisphaera agarilytica]MBB6428507.1 glutamyl-tRNA reductase [Algisphaera agarilytica]
MRLLLLGINHRTAPVELREALAINADRLPSVLDAFRASYGDGAGGECVLLSTCNRTEMYVARPSHSEPTIDSLRQFLADQTGTALDTITASSIHREQQPAVHHLFRVTAGLDAMAVGETQVIGQVRRAYEAAQNAGTVGPALNRVFQSALRDVKQAHQQSGVAGLQQSVSSMAVEFAGNLFESFSDKTVAGLGAGEITKATLQRMLGKSPGKTWVVNRSPAAGLQLAKTLGLGSEGGAEHPGGARPWGDLDEILVEADIILTGTASPEPVITASRFKKLLRRRRNRPVFFIDLAVPRDVEPAVGSLPNVYLYNIDDLNRALADVPRRREKIDRCEAMVREAAERCVGAAQHQDLGVLVRQLRNKLLDIGDQERARTQRKMQNLHEAGEYDKLESLIDEHTHRLINKVLHLPLSQLDLKKHKDEEAPISFYAAALRRLFDLEDVPGSGEASPPTPATEADDE